MGECEIPTAKNILLFTLYEIAHVIVENLNVTWKFSSFSNKLRLRSVILKANRTRIFFFLFHIFEIIDDFSKFRSIFSALHYEKSPNMANDEVKPCSTCLKPILTWNCRFPKKHGGPENFKKSRPKKLVKSNKSISGRIFLQFQKWPKINYWTGKKAISGSLFSERYFKKLGYNCIAFYPSAYLLNTF